MRALVTGGRGFAGRYLLEYLVANGHEAIALTPGCDVTQRSQLREHLEAFRPDTIFHLAAKTSVAASWEQPSEYTRVNVVGTRNLVEAAFEVVPLATFVMVSSAEVYGIPATGEPLRETSPVAPTNPYASSKVEAEHVALEAAHRGQRVVIVRPFPHTGPRQSTTFFIPAIASRLVAVADDPQPVISVGNLSARRDISDVRDVVAAYVAAAQWGVAGEIYNVCSGHDVGLEDVANQLRTLIAPGAMFEVDPVLLRPIDISVLRGSPDALHAISGWEPRYSLETTLRDLIADIRQREIS